MFNTIYEGEWIMRKGIIISTLLIISALLASCSNTSKEPVKNVVAYDNYSKAPVEAFGSIKCLKSRDIYVGFPAKIEKILIKNGQKVKKGQTIATINMQEYELQKSQKESQYKLADLELQKSEEQLKKLKQIIKVDPYDMEQMSIQLEAMEKECAELQSELTESKQLLDMGGISQQEYKLAEKSVNQKKIDIEKLKLSISKAQSSVDKQNSDNKEAAKMIENDIEGLKEKARLAKEDLDSYISLLSEEYIKDGTIISDVENGSISDLGFKENDQLDGTKKICSIVDLDQLIAEVDVSEEDIKNVKLDAPVKITPIADKSKSFSGKVSFISGDGFTQNGEIVFPVEIEFIDGGGFLLPQLSIDVEISNN